MGLDPAGIDPVFPEPGLGEDVALVPDQLVEPGHGQGGPTMKYKLPPPKQDPAVASERKQLVEALALARKAMPKSSSIKDGDVVGKWNGPAVEKDPQKYSLTKNLTISAKIRTKQPVADLVSKYDWRGKQRGYVFGIGGEGDKGAVPGHLFFWVSSRAESFSGLTVYGSQPVNDGKEHDDEERNCSYGGRNENCLQEDQEGHREREKCQRRDLSEAACQCGAF